MNLPQDKKINHKKRYMAAVEYIAVIASRSWLAW
jgi:hypothetical protein